MPGNLPLFSTYHATKFAVEGLTEALQHELQGHGIRVKLIEPGGSKTNFGSSSLVQTPHPTYADPTRPQRAPHRRPSSTPQHRLNLKQRLRPSLRGIRQSCCNTPKIHSGASIQE